MGVSWVRNIGRVAIALSVIGSALALAAASPVAGGFANPNKGYIVPASAGSAEDPNLRPPMPADLPISDGSAMTQPLSHFRGGVLLLNFWATWCAPCIKELAYLDRLQGDLKGMPFLVVPVSEDVGGIAVAKAFFQRQKVSFIRTYADPNGAAAQTLKVVGLPTSFIVDKKLRLVQRVEGPYAWDDPPIVARFRALVAEAP